jgi:phospholipid/cholesterol/gamma-HCH transport system substrate-binding protein
MKGDYTNMSADLDLNLANLLGNLSKSAPTPGGTPTGPGGLPSLPLPTPSLPGLPVQPSPSGTSATGKVCIPGTICVGSAERSSSSDGSWRSLYGGGA